MSRSELPKKISRWALPVLATYAAYELSQSSFSSSVRNKTILRDKFCQLEGCQDTNMVAHHIIPESMANGKDHYQPGSSLYVDILRLTWQETYRQIQQINRGYAKRVKKDLRSFIKSPRNSITLCCPHHNGLHNGDFDYTIPIQKNHQIRPRTFQMQDVQAFLFAALIDTNPKLEETLNFNEIAQIGYHQAISYYD